MNLPHALSRCRPAPLSTGLRGTAVRAFLAAAALAALIVPARGQEGPIVVGRQEHPPLLTLDPFTGTLGITGLMQADNSKSSGSNSSSTSALIQESLELATGGGVVSRSFLDWHADVTVGLDENWDSSGGTNSSGLGFVDAYNLSATLLGETLFPSTYYARRTESYVARSFQPLAKDTTTEYGATFNYLSEKIPTELSLYHVETNQSDLGGASQFTLTEDHAEFQTSFDPFEHHHISINASYVVAGQNTPGSPSESYDSQNLSLNHTWQIDNAARYFLSESISYAAQSGVFSSEQFSLSEQLRMRHTEDFETSLEYLFDRQSDSQSLTQDQHLIASFNHHLFESLSTFGQIGALKTSRSFDPTLAGAGNSDTTTYFANLTSNYTKKIPFGTFGANLSLGYNQTDNGPIGSVQPILNDMETFTDPQPIIITRTGVNPNSIAIFNAARTRRFLPGTDYIVTRVGNTIQIERPITSNINSGDTVLLNYDVDPLPGYSTATTSFTAGTHYTFTQGPLTGLELFAEYTQQDQSLSSSSSSSLLQADNINDIDYGAEYRIWKLTFHAERQDHQSTLDPYDATRFSALYSDRLSPASNFSLSANQSFIEYPNGGSNSSLTTVDGHLDYQISRQLKAITTARFRNGTDSRFGNTMGFEEEGELRWTIRQTQIFFLIRHTALEASSNELQSFSAQFGITRNF